MQWTAIFAKLFDPYDLKARLWPGLLVLLPAIMFLVLIYGPKHPLLVALSSVLATCGGPYFLASFVRSWGQRAQDQLNLRWGGQPSTIMLRHSNEKLPTQTKQRYHALCVAKLGISMPTPEQEADDMVKADASYIAAANALRPLTSDKKEFDLLFKELVAYGYNRNAYGSRCMGLAVAVGAAAATVIHAGAFGSQPPYFDPSKLQDAHVLMLVACVLFILLWSFHFTGKTVELAGYSYAKRLWEALEKVPRKAGPMAGSTATADEFPKQ